MPRDIGWAFCRVLGLMTGCDLKEGSKRAIDDTLTRSSAELLLLLHSTFTHRFLIIVNVNVHVHVHVAIVEEVC